MIEEINNFIEKISESYPELYKTCSNRMNAIYILLKADGSIQEAYVGKNNNGKKDDNNILEKCREFDFYSESIDANKYIDSDKKISSCSPFAMIFSSYNATKKVQRIYDEIKNRFDDYFKEAKKYCENEDLDEQIDVIKKYCNNNLIGFLSDNKILDDTKFFKEEITTENGIEFKTGYSFRIYLDMDVEHYKKCYSEYLRNYIFVKDEYNSRMEDGTIYGVPSFFTTYNDKKQYLVHNSAPFEHNLKVNYKKAINLLYFSKLVKFKSLPNPLPIFIFNEELNLKVVKLFNEDKVESYSKIISNIFENHQQDLGNYYLLNYTSNKINDFDFVNLFRYNINPPIELKDLFYSNKTIHIDNIFSFERNIFNIIFNLKEDDNLNYFGDLKLKDSVVQINLIKYRKAIYDYIYKSKEQSIKQDLFGNLISSLILNDLRKDEYKNNKHTRNLPIINKLNIWFNLYEYFLNQNIIKMPELISNLQKENKSISESENNHFKNDEEFAFASGQVIYYLLSQSESSNRTHALLEPFLQKTDVGLFKDSIIRQFNKYKHNIRFKQSKFEKLMSEVLSYKLDKSLSDLMPFILAGYFSKNEIYLSNNKLENEK